MNINDPNTDLTLALGSGNHRVGTRVNSSSSSGAGVNADSRVYIPFAASDPLSELVWSPNNGLSIKCASSSFLDKKPFLTWNVSESKQDNSTSQSIRSKGSQDIKISDEKKMRASPKMFRSTGASSTSNLDTHPRNHDVKVSETVARSLPNLQPRDKPYDEATSASGDVNKNKTTAPIPIPAPTLMMLESSAENDLDRLAGKDGAPADSRICLYQERGKGKEKVSSDGDMWARSSNDEDDSHESKESCNSTRLFPKSVKRPNFGPVQIIGSKRMRGTHDSTSFVKPDSSFMNWISNMVKGLSDYSKQDPSPLNAVLNETTDCTRPSMGFQTVFQSLYHQSTKDNRSVAESRQVVVADGKNENSCKQIVLACTPNSSERTNASEIPECKRAKGGVIPYHSSCEKVNSSSEKMGLNSPQPVSYMPGKSSPFSSLWITRLYTRTDRLENCNQITEEARDCSSEYRKANLDSRTKDVLSSDDCAGDADRASEAMASVFAKRLELLRHIVRPSETTRSPSCQLICLFCGRSGHDLRLCPKLTATELDDLLVKISSFIMIEKSPCLCIRCFQLDHWAISCPLQLPSDDKCSSRIPSTSNLLQKCTLLSSEHHLKDKHIFPLIDARNAVPEEQMFNAISKLRLSRANILRWMNSDVPLSHLNGFFLRLRVGKLEGGLEETTYYVACITGDTIESINSKSKKSILVDVGGIKSSVGSQYISNHDFLEDEIKAWWSRIVKNGCKIPSIDELNSKYERMKRLSL
ncbi:hypothetical protein ACS0TY_014366 [Phlomoides rotata]